MTDQPRAGMTADVVRRLRGEYRIRITDGLGAAGGEEPDNANEFVRTFPTPPIQKEAASLIEAQSARILALEAGAREAMGALAIAHVDLSAAVTVVEHIRGAALGARQTAARAKSAHDTLSSLLKGEMAGKKDAANG